MKQDQRWQAVGYAHNFIDKAVIDAVGTYSLSYDELFGILGQIMCSWAKWQVKSEREEK